MPPPRCCLPLPRQYEQVHPGLRPGHPDVPEGRSDHRHVGPAEGGLRGWLRPLRRGLDRRPDSEVSWTRPPLLSHVGLLAQQRHRQLLCAHRYATLRYVMLRPGASGKHGGRERDWERERRRHSHKLGVNSLTDRGFVSFVPFQIPDHQASARLLRQPEGKARRPELRTEERHGDL